MKKFKISKYSQEFLKRTVILFSIVMFVCSAILFAIFGAILFNGNIRRAKEDMSLTNERSYGTFQETMENCMRVCSYFSTYENISPVFQFQTDVDLYKSMLMEEMKSIISSFDYIQHIKIETAEFTIQYGRAPIGQPVFLQKYYNYSIEHLLESSWPESLQLVYNAGDSTSFTVTLSVKITEMGRKSFGDNTYFVTADGRILISQDTNLLGRNIHEVYDIPEKNLLSSDATPGFEKNLIPLSDGSSCFVTLLPSSQLISNSLWQILLLLLAFVITVCATSVILFFVVKSIYAPIANSLQILKYYLPDEPSIVDDDLEFILDCISGDDLNESAKKTIKQIRRSQLYALHSQISPHFLGNSLEVIKGEVAKHFGYDTPIENALSTLGGFMCDAHEYQKMIISVKDECSKAEQYLELTKFCFNEVLTVHWEVDPSLRDCAIIGMTLQPLLENSIMHGFVGCPRPPHIDILFQPEELNNRRIVVLTVRDNGTGIEDHILKDIVDGLQDTHNSRKHIGLKNTHHKFRLLYGEDFGIHKIESGRNGTTVVIRFPYFPA